MIDVDDVTVQYGELTAIQGIDVRIDDGEFVTVIGPSGCGKTTLLHTIGGLQSPTAGTIDVDGRAPDVAQSAGDIGFVFQRHALLPWKSALENVVFLRRMAGKSPEQDEAIELLESMGLGDFVDERPAALSGGMKQRVAIARALHLDAAVLLMDEPFGELDELTREEMGIEVRHVWREDRKTVVFVTHSVPEAVFLGDRCVVFQGTPGRIETTVDIDLPRPRDETVLESNAYQDQVGEIRRVLR